jgi:hypothetical protein
MVRDSAVAKFYTNYGHLPACASPPWGNLSPVGALWMSAMLP